MEDNYIFTPFKKKHEGETGILFATGPTVSKYIPIEEHDKSMKVGVNNIGAMIDFEIDYLFIGDKKVQANTIDMLRDGTFPPVRIQKFAGCYLDGRHIATHISPEDARSIDALPFSFHYGNEIHEEIDKENLYDHSVVFSALQFMVWTGVTKICLVGCDVSGFKGGSEDKLLELWKIWKDYLMEKSIQVVSINPVGLTGMFEDKEI
jgi:hypothetical protein